MVEVFLDWNLPTFVTWHSNIIFTQNLKCFYIDMSAASADYFMSVSRVGSSSMLAMLATIFNSGKFG